MANLYYTLLMLDEQYAVSQQTAAKWRQSVETMRALKEAGMTNEAGVAQYEANYAAIEASLFDLEHNIKTASAPYWPRRRTPSSAAASPSSICPRS